MEIETLVKYAQTYNKINELKAELDTLGTLILAELATKNLKRLEQEGVGTFSLSERRSWSYSSGVDTLRKNLKAAEKEEQDQGVAEYSITEYLRFSAKSS